MEDGFNSRSRVGSDPFPPPGHPLRTRFNSRSRVGSDTRQLGVRRCATVSIHAPV